MYNAVKNVIANKGYDLKDILKKIDVLWVKGSLSDEQREELITLARDNANAQNSINVMEKLEEMDKRIIEIEKIVFAETEEPEYSVNEYEVGKWYYAGDEVVFEGDTYTCIAPDGVVCTWSPAEYPEYWQKKE